MRNGKMIIPFLVDTSKKKGMVNMKNLEQTLDSREVAEMVEKEHRSVIRDIRRYIKQINECNHTSATEHKIVPSDFFEESTYKDSTGRTLPCYMITRKGCEFIANKLTGTKGTEFTARYINRFHEMEDEIASEQIQNQAEYLAKALLEARRMLDEKDKQIKILEQRKTAETYDYKKYIISYVGQIQNQRRLCQIYTIVKNMHKHEQEKGV
jgi:Rha family phage regulatory protein